MSRKSISLQRYFRCMLLAALIFASCFAGGRLKAYAATTVASGTSNYGLTWTLDSNGTLTISGTSSNGRSAVVDSYDAWYSYQDSIKKVVMESGIAKISDYAFCDYGSLTSVTIPTTVKSIGIYAFAWCDKLADIALSSGVTSLGKYAFVGCSELTSISVPSGITSIENGTFESCTSLSSVTLPSGLLSIDEYGFFGCSALTKITIPSTVETIGDYAFQGCEKLTSITIPASVSSIGVCAFFKCVGLKTVVMKSGLCSIGGAAFEFCSSLTSVTLPSGLTCIEEELFRGCTSLSSISIPSGVTDIGKYAFYGCSSLTGLTLPSGLTEINDYTFYGCSALTSLTLPSGLTVIGNYAFYKCTSLESLSLPSTLKTIGDYAFWNCGIEGVTLPSSITSLGKGVFGLCQNMKYLYIADGISEISEGAFDACSSLIIVRIPKSVKSIGTEAFDTCSAIAEVYYGGSKSNWSSISIGSSNTYLTKGTFTYNSTTSVVVPMTEITELQVKSAGVTVRWETAYGANGYYIYRSASADGSYEKVGTVQGGTTSYYTDTTVSKNTTYYYKVQGYKSDAKASLSEAKSVKFVKNLVTTVTSLSSVKTYNIGHHEYYDWHNWSQPDYSYLVAVDSGFMRVEYTGSCVVVEYYDSNWQLTAQKTITCELPLFGGFYAGEDAYYLVFAQYNYDYDDNQEVIRVVKYSTGWARNTNASVYGANTTTPFRAGSLSMTESGGYLYIRTCHDMYSGHQANMSIVVNESNMTVTGLDCEVTDYGSCYVSHSFNQLILTDDAGNLVAADHGDAYPRGILLTLMEGVAGTSAYVRGNYSAVKVRSISGDTGKNYTATTLGDLEYSDSSYLVAGSSVAMNDSWNTNSQYNIFVTVTSRTNFSSDGTSIKWITTYAEGKDIDVSNPYLVKISDTKFLLMWTENSTTLKYVFLNGKGVKTSNIYSATAYLSDCEPLYENGYVYWYTTGDSNFNVTTPVLYSIKVSSPSTVTKKTASVYLAKCSVSYVCNTMDGLKVAWNQVSGATGYYIYRRNSDGTYSSTPTATVAGAATVNWTDTSTLTGGKSYTYKVAAYYKDSSGKVTVGSSGTTKTCMYLKGSEVTKVANISTGLKVTWTKVSGANGYYVYRKVSGGDYVLVKTISGGSTVSWTDTTAADGKTYTYKVSAIFTNSSGQVTKGGAKTTKTYVRLVAPTISSLANSASKALTVKWGAKSGVTGYQIQYSTSNSFSSGNTTVKVTGASSASKVISGLTKGKTYYVRVRVYKTVSGTKYYSAWSSKKNVKISK